MCLAIPGKVIEWTERDPLFAQATVEFAGVRRAVSMSCVPNAKVGDFVLVHAGIGIARIDTQEAERLLASLAEIDMNEDVECAPNAATHPSETTS